MPEVRDEDELLRSRRSDENHLRLIYISRKETRV
jgi:hypothetical protein